MIVVLSIGTTTVELLSYQLTGKELEALVADLVVLDHDGWIAAGGLIR